MSRRTSLLSRLCSAFRSPKSAIRNPKSEIRVPSRRLFLESLEDRSLLTTGFLDPTFGDGGKVITNFPVSRYDNAKDLVVQSDGRAIVLGTSDGTSSVHTALARYNSDGTLDNSFGTGGLVIQDFAAGRFLGQTVGLQADGKIVVSGSIDGPINTDFAVARFTTSGALDSSFGNNGLAFTDVGPQQKTVNASIVESDGSILLAGTSTDYDSATYYWLALTHFTADGSLDTSFGNNGTALVDVGLSWDGAPTGVAVQTSGKILVAGTFAGNGFDVARLSANGSLDHSFGNSGIATADFGAGDNQSVMSAALQADGKIVLAGYASSDFAVARFTTNGALDASFSGDGMATADSGSADSCNDVAIQSDGKMVVAGNAGANLAVARFTSAGVLDSSFDGDGFAMVDFGGAGSLAKAVAIQSNGNIIAAGSFQSDFAIARLTPAGALDSSFDGDGKAVTDFHTGSDEETRAVVVQPDGKTVVLAYIPSYFQPQFFLLRYNADGSLDGSFGSGGRAMIDVGPGFFDLRAVALEPDGKIVVAGSISQYSGLYQSHMLVARFTPSGVGDASFGDDGHAICDYSFRVSGPSTDKAYAMTVAPNGDILVAGTVGTFGSPIYAALSRFSSAGVGFPGFLNPIGFSPSVMAVQPGGPILVGGAAGGVFKVARAGDYYFGTGGIASISLGSDARIAGLTVQPNGKILLTGTSNLGATGDDFVLARLTAAGALDSSFGAGGIATADFGSQNDQAVSLAVQSDGKIVVAGNSNQGASTGSDFAVARFTATGMLDTSYNGNGKTTADFGSLDDSVAGLAVDGDDKAIVLGRSYHSLSGDDIALARFKREPFRVTGTDDNDTIVADPGTVPGTLKITVNGTVYDKVDGPAFIDGLDGSDSYIVNFGASNSAGSVIIGDTGSEGTDTLVVNGTAQDDTLAKAAGFIKWRPTSETAYRQEVDFDGMEGVTLNAGAGNDTINDPNSGNFVILGGPGNDTITIADTTGPVTVDGGDGADTYIVQAGNLQGPVTINDTGAAGTDAVTIQGTAGADTITQTGNQVVANGATITLTGADTLNVDGGGGAGDTFSVIGTPSIPATVQGVSDMVVTGTTGNDQILFNPGNSPGQVVAKLNGVVVASMVPTGRIIAYGLAGNDDIQVASGVNVPAWLYGDAGNDRLNAGNGGSLLIGGDGNDQLIGGNGRDVMIGGEGADNLVGNSNDDILVAGLTTKDSHAVAANDQFWMSVLAEWNSSRTFAARVQNLRSVLLPQVQDDVSIDAIDFLNGSAGDDWLIFLAGEDKVSGKAEAAN